MNTAMKNSDRGIAFVLSSPSGAGKSTLARRLLEADSKILLSVSATTRKKRANETNGVDYLFVDDDEFARMVKENAFLEHATVFGNQYGTPLAPIETTLSQGKDVLFDIDWQGAEQVAIKLPDDHVSVFILPPSLEELHRRLKERAQDSDDVVASRMEKAVDEIRHWKKYDYVLINEDIDQCFGEIKSILHAARQGENRDLPSLDDFVRTLISDL
jgi:guanylate kinase